MLSMTRGDTAGFYFNRYDNEGQVITTRPQSLFFTLKKSYRDQKPVLQKNIDQMVQDDDGAWHFVLQAGETDALKYGTYVFDIQVVDQDAKTTISKGELEICEESTWISNED